MGKKKKKDVGLKAKPVGKQKGVDVLSGVGGGLRGVKEKLMSEEDEGEKKGTKQKEEDKVMS